jgi:hypothetical protein
MTTSATASDYDWFGDRLPGLAEAYCLILARDLAPEEFLARIGARPVPDRTGVDALFEPSMNLWAEHGDDAGLFIGVTTVAGDGGNWALGVEINGFLGVTEQIIVPLSEGTRLVSHFRNVNAADRFCWVEDGDVRLEFEPLFATNRHGSTPDALLSIMQEVGFDLREDSDAEHHTEAAFALAERVTGVRITAELLENAVYTCGIAPVR